MSPISINVLRSSASIARDKAAAATLDRLLVALEAPPVDEGARARLARSLDRHGAPHVTLLIRTILESEGNAAALVEPVIGAVSSVMVFNPEWANRGLAWIEAFDNVPLMALLQSIIDLCIFQPEEIRNYMFLALRARLRKAFEPPEPPKLKPPRKVKRPRDR
jgi:hypothetical protein